ncbi:sodium/potassium/calcium exchanger 5-like isoform X1 [Bolinopsis microptera]|uniref:sodium/potassium/calcium exchanger 5-like isoform X1 n=1 Tax=Bolinopsis microptera TaxID=2820187 RepID=UPI003079D304
MRTNTDGFSLETLSHVTYVCKWKMFFPVTFIMSILWIAVFSYLMVWWTETLGRTLGLGEKPKVYTTSGSTENRAYTVWNLDSLLRGRKSNSDLGGWNFNNSRSRFSNNVEGNG